MANIKSRLDKIQEMYFAGSIEQYRDLCHGYNLETISSDDLWEAIIAFIEARPMNPDVKTRLYAPLPPYPDSDRLKRAKNQMQTQNTIDIDKDVSRLKKEYEMGVKDGTIIPDGYAQDLSVMNKLLLREKHGPEWYKNFRDGMAEWKRICWGDPK